MRMKHRKDNRRKSVKREDRLSQRRPIESRRNVRNILKAIAENRLTIDNVVV